MSFAFSRVIGLCVALAALLVVAVPAALAQSAGWQAGPGAALESTYDGFVDLPRNGDTVTGSGSFTISGWFVDRTAQGWAGADDVQVWLGTMDGDGRLLAKALFAQARPDVGAATGNSYWAASGFQATIAGSSVPARSQTLNVYVHTGGKGWWFKSVVVNGGGPANGTTAPAAGPASGGAPVVDISNPTNNENVSTKRSDYTISGTVSDAASIDRIEVWINGERDSKYGALLGTTTPTPDGAWSVTFKPTRFPSTHSNLYVYAHNQINGLETVVNREINIVDK